MESIEDEVIRALAGLDASDGERRAVREIVRDAWQGDEIEHGALHVAEVLLAEYRDTQRECEDAAAE